MQSEEPGVISMDTVVTRGSGALPTEGLGNLRPTWKGEACVPEGTQPLLLGPSLTNLKPHQGLLLSDSEWDKDHLCGLQCTIATGSYGTVPPIAISLLGNSASWRKLMAKQMIPIHRHGNPFSRGGGGCK